MWYALIINDMIVDMKWATRWPDPADFEAFDAEVVSPDATVVVGKCEITILDEEGDA